MRAVLPVMQVNIARPWSETVFCVDASEWGNGITFTDQDGDKHGELPLRLVAHQQMIDVLLAYLERQT